MSTDVETDDESADPAQRVWNIAGFSVANESTTLTRTIDLVRSTLTSRYSYQQASLNPLIQSRISFGLAPVGQTCSTTTTRTTVWTVKEAGATPPANGLYTAPETATFDLAPEQTRHVCLDVELTAPSDSQSARHALLKQFAGGGIKAITGFKTRERLSTNGVESAESTLRYRLGLPQPIADSSINGGQPGCRKQSGGFFQGYNEVFWDWLGTNANPGPGNSLAIDHWELWSTGRTRNVPPNTGYTKLVSSDVMGSDHNGNLPANTRSVRLERALYGNVFRPGIPYYRNFLLVGVLKGSNTRIVAPTVWTLSWNGHSSEFFNEQICSHTLTTPANATGVPNMPGATW